MKLDSTQNLYRIKLKYLK